MTTSSALTAFGPASFGTAPLRPSFPTRQPAQIAKTKTFEWTRGETIALAKSGCTQCVGIGLHVTGEPCNCVLRAIFDACFTRFQRVATQEKHLSKASLEPACGRTRPSTWGRKDEEFIADFTLMAKRALSAEEHKLFRYHFLLGADWKLCTRQLKMDRGNFFHALYRIKQKLGRVFRETKPYGLFPLDEYFNGTREELSRSEEILRNHLSRGAA